MGTESGAVKSARYVRFAAVWFMLVGVLSVVAGVVAIARKEYFEDAQELYGSLGTWGVVWIVEGAVSIVVGWLIHKGSKGAQTFGVILACVGLVVWFFCVGLMPVWAIVHLIAYALVVWALVVHGTD